MRLVFFGSGAFGLPTLARLSQSHEVAMVVTQPDRPAGRGSRLTPTPIGDFASASMPGTTLLKPAKVNAAEVISQIRAAQADAWVVIAFGQKLGRALLEGVFAINLHASLLPRWRGAAPINAAILAGDAITGNSVITLADRMDAGLILATTTRPIGRLQTAGELHDLLSDDGPDLVERVLQGHASGTLAPIVQLESEVTIAGKLSKQDGVADFRKPAEFLRRQIHALTPWPGVGVTIEGKDTTGPQRLKLLRTDADESRSDEPAGTLVDVAHGVISCAGGSVLRVLEVQPSGRNAMRWEDFVRGAGRSIEEGAMVSSERGTGGASAGGRSA